MFSVILCICFEIVISIYKTFDINVDDQKEQVFIKSWLY